MDAVRRTISAVLAILMPIATSGCAATPAVLERWNPSGEVYVRLAEGHTRLSEVSFQWSKTMPTRKQREIDKAAGLVGPRDIWMPSLLGTLPLSLRMEGCAKVEMYAQNGTESAAPMSDGLVFIHQPTADDAERRAWESLPNPACSILIAATRGPSGDAHLRVSTQSEQVALINLGPTSYPRWAAALPFALIADAAIVAVVATVVVIIFGIYCILQFYRYP
jgi:hypothetical protein